MKNCKKTLRRGLALFVALVMCLSVMSITAYAEEVVPEPETLTEEETPDESANQEEPAGEKEPAEEIPDTVEVVEPAGEETPAEGVTPVEDETPAFARSLFSMTAYANSPASVMPLHTTSALGDSGYYKFSEWEGADQLRLYPSSVYDYDPPAWTTASSVLDLWVYSNEMLKDGKNDGSCVPYFCDPEGTTWYLEKITWDIYAGYPDGGEQHEIMSNEQILAAVGNKSAYQWKQTLEGGDFYGICYWWTADVPEIPEEPDVPEYTINYNFNQPAGTTVVAVETDGRIDGLNQGIWNPNPKPGVKAGEILQLIPESKYTAYFAYNTGTGADFLNSGFYTFKGWKIGDKEYTEEPITVTAEMADENGNIKLTGVWSETVKMNELTTTDMPKLTSAISVYKTVAAGQIPSPTWGYGLDVELDENRQVQYMVRFNLIGNAFDNATDSTSTDFKFHLEMDRNLRWAEDENGQITFQYTSTNFRPLSISCGEKEIPLTVGEDGSFTVQASSLTDQNGVIQPFDVNLGWRVRAEKPTDDTLYLPCTKLIVPEDQPDYEAKVTGRFEGYADTHINQVQKGPFADLAQKMVKQADWQAYFTSKNITEYVTQLAYAMWYASQPKSDSLPINVQVENQVTAKVAQRDYTVVHEYWDGKTQKGQVSDIPVKAYAGDVVRATKAMQTTYQNDTYTLRANDDGTYPELTVSKSGKNTLVLYYDLSACAHEWSNWSVTQAPTCTVEGVETRTCTKCHTPDTQAIAALGHDWREAWERNEDGHWHICTVCGAASEAEAHVYPDEWTVRTPATTTAEGEEYRDCTACGHEVTRPIAQLPVTPVIPPVTPPVTPSIPDTPTPLDPGTNIPDEEVPLANTVGLNNIDHFAYIAGYEDGTVRPTNNITRAEVATIFFRLMTEEYRVANWSTSNTFTDANPSGWYNAAISTAAKAGILKGYADGSVKPNANITRAEFAAIAARFISDDITDDGAGDFSDTANHWAAKEIRLAAKAGWVQGDGGRFRPDDPITRAEVMIMVNRMLDRVPDADHMLPGMKTWSDNPAGTWYYAAVQEATNDHAYERAGDGVTEIWMELTEAKDWAALEAEWAANNGASAPKAETETQGRRLPDGI